MPRFPPHPERRPAVVSGASSGIGEATALLLAEAGHPVVLGARRLGRCEETAAKIRADGGEAVALPLDVGDPTSVATFTAAAVEQLGPIEVVVSNAGDVLADTVVATGADDFAAQVHVNLLGAHRLVSLLAPAMVSRERGDIVFITSDVVRAPRPHMASYVASKWGLEGMARVMQMELEGTGVRAGIVRPGPTMSGQGSDWSAETIDTVMAEWTRWGLLRHAGYLRPKDVAAAVLAVVSAPKGTHLTLVEVEPEAPVIDQGGST